MSPGGGTVTDIAGRPWKTPVRREQTLRWRLAIYRRHDWLRVGAFRPVRHVEPAEAIAGPRALFPHAKRQVWHTGSIASDCASQVRAGQPNRAELLAVRAVLDHVALREHGLRPAPG